MSVINANRKKIDRQSCGQDVGESNDDKNRYDDRSI